MLIDWYLPGYKAGGPIQSVANIISHLKNEFEFSVITSDTDLHESQPYQNITANAWNKLEDGTRVYYFSAARRSFKNLKNLLVSESYDVIYMNSFFSVFFTLYPLLILKQQKIKRRIIIAPRGMLGAGALQLKSAKKKLFITAARIFGLYSGVTWHASTELEREEIKNTLGKNAIVNVAINLSKKRAIVPVPRIKNSGKLKLAFLSRISPKKNLLAVYNYLAAMPPDAEVTFDYYGPVDDADYYQQCLKAFAALPPAIKATYCNTLEPTQITAKLSEYHFTILPTLNENFGHAIVESWVAGCPVIISDQTPWRQLSSKKCGWDLPLTDSDFIATLRTSVNMNQQDYDEWSNGAYRMAEEIVNDHKAIEQNQKLFA